MAISVALVRVLGEDRLDRNSCDYNLGLRYLASIVRKNNAECEIYDPFDIPPKDHQNHFFKRRYDLIGFTVHYFNIGKTLDLCHSIKKIYPETLIIFGGHHATTTQKEILEENAFVDAICCGEGEDVIGRVILALNQTIIRQRKIEGPLKSKCFVSLDQLQFPKPPTQRITARISTSRGCPYSCTFCTTPALRKLLIEPAYRFRSAENVFEEIFQLYSSGYSNIKINDDVYIIPTKESRSRAHKIAQLLIKESVTPISYKVELRVDSITYKDFTLIKILKTSGLKRVFLGIESASDRILKEYNKQVTFLQTLRTVTLFEKAGIVVDPGNMLVSPDATIDEISRSIIGFRQMGLAYFLFRRKTFHTNIFPGTEMERTLSKQGRLEDKPRYLPRKYTFKDKRIDDVVNLLEDNIPWFIKEVGEELFSIRGQLLEKYYDGKLQESAYFKKLINDLNEKSADFLLRWFRSLPARRINCSNFRKDFNEYCNYVTRLKNFLKIVE